MRVYFYVILLLFWAQSACLCPNYTFSQNSVCMPCGIRCVSCTSQTACTQCSEGYKMSSGSCVDCPYSCSTCNSTACSKCYDPYVLVEGVCKLCLVDNAVSCSTLTNVTTCLDTYFSQETFCSSCVLHCQSCVNPTTCQTCLPGYILQYQNSVCAGCSGCKKCTNTPTNCSYCWAGTSLDTSSGSGVCRNVTCTVGNCRYCSAVGVCQICQPNYYLNNSVCTLGSSLLCGNGASGNKPNDCINNCSASQKQSTDTAPFSCLPKRILQKPLRSQKYFYVPTDYAMMNTTVANQCLNEGYSISFNNFTWQVGNFYRLQLEIKGYAISSGNATLFVKADNITENVTAVMQGSCQPTYIKFSSVELNSDSLTMSLSSGGSFGLVYILLTTYSCSLDCRKCLNPYICLVCLAPLYFYNYKCIIDCGSLYRLNQSNILSCVLTCPVGSYNQYSQVSCVECPTSCTSCSNSTVCFGCKTVNSTQYYYLSLNNSCLLTCPDGYYGKNNICMNCLAPCRKCNETSCLSCQIGYWNGTGCASQCQSGQYGNDNTQQCYQCQGCLTCTISATYCTSCQTPLLLSDNRCVSTCRDGMYSDGVTCKRCIPPCNRCNQSQCLSCSYGFYSNGSCLNNCPAGYFGNVDTFECQICQANCTACTTLSYCTNCIPGLCLFNGMCQTSTCVDTYYALNVTGSCICTSCSYPCLTCSSQSVCLSCISGYLSDGKCNMGCPSGQFGNDTSQKCQNCSSLFNNCRVCSQTECLACITSFILDPYAVACVVECPTTMYSKNDVCQWCVYPCLTCTNQTECVTCRPAYVKRGTSCLRQCPIGYYPQNSTCLVCYSPCLTCTGPTTCLSCIRTNSNQTYFHNGSCVTSCPSGYYSYIITLRCYKCLSPCLTCQSQTSCLSCLIGFLTNNKCEQCPIGTYVNSSSCVKCANNCGMCINSTLCNYCVNSTLLFEGTCIQPSDCSAKPEYYVSLLGICAKCQSPCRTCISYSQCVSCLSGYMFYNNNCVISCPAGYFGSIATGNCTVCSPECLTCVGNASVCLKCSLGYVYYQRSCLSTCPNRTYLLGQSCSDCKYPCSTCTSDVFCLGCQNGLLDSVTGKCIASCPSGTFGNTSGTCVNCSSNCQYCSGNASTCTACSVSQFLMNASCVSSCPSGYFGDSQAASCFKCIPPCDYCIDEVTCLTCSGSYAYSSTLRQCLSVCPDGTYNVSSISIQSRYTCLACNSQCLTCVGPVQCQTCRTGVILNGTCTSSCPSKMFTKDGGCFPCTYPCFDCLSSTVCTSCITTSDYMLVGGSSCTPGLTCPAKYYAQPNSKSCLLSCPAGYFKNSITRTCVTSCPADNFISTDLSCVTACDASQYSNSSYFCIDCTVKITDRYCPQALNFKVQSEVVDDQLYLRIVFSSAIEVNRNITKDDISLTPSFSFRISDQNVTVITLLADPNTSLTSTYLKVTIMNPFAIFKNSKPLVNPYQYHVFPGYDKYNTDLPNYLTASQIFAVFCTVVCLFRGYLAVDFIQHVYMYSLISSQFPTHLQAFLKGFKLSNFALYFIQSPTIRVNKFTNMSLLQNCLYIMIVFVVFLLVYLAAKMIRKHTSANTTDVVEQTPSIKYQIYEFIDTQLHVRILWFFYCYLSIYCFCYWYILKESRDSAGVLSRVLSFPIGIALIVVPPIVIYKIESFYGVLMLRKLLECGCLVMATNHPIYVIGFFMVGSMCILAILPVQKQITWKVEILAYSICYALQILCCCLFVGMEFIGKGQMTDNKVTLGSVIMCLIVTICLVYVLINVMLFVLWAIKLCGGQDYLTSWTTTVTEQETKESTDSDLVSDDKLNEAPVIPLEMKEDTIYEFRYTKKTSRVNPTPTRYAYVRSLEARSIDDTPSVLVKVVTRFDDLEIS